MKMPASAIPPRPFRIAARTVRSRAEAARELARWEQERCRLEQEIDRLQARAMASWRALEEAEARSAALRAVLARGGSDAAGETQP
jgi:hypothetical protein